MGQYSSRVANRTKLAKELKTKLARAQAEGIVEEDLDAMAQAGDEAREADREQRAQLADDDVRRNQRAGRDQNVLARGDKVRNRMPAVSRSLIEQGHVEDGKFVNAVSFAYYRMNGLPEVDPALAEDPAVKAVTRVERADKLSLLGGLANLTKTFLTRENIVNELARRGIDRDALTQLQADAEASFEDGKNQRRAAEATKREHEAVARQTALWTANRRMLREAVQGDPVLEAIYAGC